MSTDLKQRVNFKKLRQTVLAKQPVLNEIILNYGHKNLLDYVNDYRKVNLTKVIISRQDELIKTFRESLAERLGQDVASRAANQLKKFYYVSTADHHGPICHPCFLNSNIVTALNCLAYPDSDLKQVIVLSCANVSLNNFSFPRGLLFQNESQKGIKLHKLPFFHASSRMCSVYNYQPYKEKDLRRVKSLLITSIRNKEIKKERGEKIIQLIENIYDQDDCLNSKSYAEQITKTNFLLWRQLGKLNGERNFPDLIYYEQEDLVARLLIKYHLTAPTIINRILFDSETATHFKKYFEGQQNTFNLAEKSGTYLFWAHPAGEKYRKQLWKKGDYLISTDGKWRVELKAGKLAEALNRGELIPSLLLTFLRSSFLLWPKMSWRFLSSKLLD